MDEGAETTDTVSVFEFPGVTAVSAFTGTAVSEDIEGGFIARLSIKPFSRMDLMQGTADRGRAEHACRGA